MPIARQPASNRVGARPTPFVKTASEATKKRINEVLGADGVDRRRMLLVSTTGPTSFVVADCGATTPDDDEARVDAGAGADAGDADAPAPAERQKHRVKIGHTHSCSCGFIDGELCHHALFVLLKVLRVPRDNPLAFQTSLLESELEAVLRFRALADQQARQAAKRHRITQMRAERRSLSTQPAVPMDDVPDGALVPGPRAPNAPQMPAPEEDCPICMDSLGDGAPLTYCPRSCGNWVHVRCLAEYAEHTAPRDARCPLCRDVWGGSDLIQACRMRLRREAATPLIGTKGSDTHRLRCAGCGVMQIVGDRYRCVKCDSVDLCSACFGRGRHGHHAFVSKGHVGDKWTAAPRVKSRRPNAWRPAAGLLDAGLPASALAALQYRDLSPNDYTMLQQLDASEPALPRAPRSLGAYLAKGLKAAQGGTCGACGTACDATYACGHAAHRACVASAVDATRPEDVICPTCRVAAFPGLRRKARPRAEVLPPQNAAAFGSVVARSVVQRSPPRAGAGGLDALVVGARVGPAASVVGATAPLGALAAASVGATLFTGSLAAMSVGPTTSMLDAGSVFTLSNAPASPGARVALAVAQRSQRAALDRGDRAARARQRRAAAATRGATDLVATATYDARAGAALERRDQSRETRRRAAADRSAATADRRAARVDAEPALAQDAPGSRDARADAARDRAHAARYLRRRAVADRRSAVAARRAVPSGVAPVINELAAAAPPLWLADAVRSASAPEDGVLQRRRLLKQRQRAHEERAVAVRARRARINSAAGRVVGLAPPRIGFAHEG